MRRSAPLALFCWLAGGTLHGLGLYVLFLRWFPLTWTYRPNDLGIVSLATLARYPAQQEIWYAAAAVLLPLAWALLVTCLAAARAPAPGALSRGARWTPVLAVPLAWVLFAAWPGRVAALAWFGLPLALVFFFTRGTQDAPVPEASQVDDRPHALLAATGALVGAAASAALGAPEVRTPAAWALAGAALGALAGMRDDRARLSRRLAPLALLALYPYVAPLGVGAGLLALAVLALTALLARFGPLPARAAGALVVVACAAAVALDPSTVQRITCGIPDLAVVDVGYSSLAEHGQRLEYGERWVNGELPGRDFIYLYGPLMLEMIRGAWALFGRTCAALLFSYQLQDLAGILCVTACAFALLRTRAFAAVTLVATVPLYLRSGIAGLALAGLASEAPAAWFGAGLCTGASALYSHEFAIALIAAGLVLCATGQARARLAWWAAGTCLAAVPYVLYLAARGALAPILETMVSYPKLMFAGYSKVQYPSLASMLPLVREPSVYLPGFANFGRVLVGFYALPLFYLAGACAVLARRLAGVAVTHRERLVIGLTVFGLIAFRPALGHSCLGHQEALIWPAVLLAAFVLEAVALRCRPAAPLLLLLIPLAFTIKPAWYRFDDAWRAFEVGRIRGGTGLLYEFVTNGGPRAGELASVVAEVRRTTPAGAPILCLPHVSAYHFYTGRPDPTRYPILISRAHREDAVRSLEARPPACVIYDIETDRLDGLPDRLVLDEVLTWVLARYSVRRRIGRTLLLYPR